MPKRKVLVVFANPIGTQGLRLDEEARTIRERSRMSRERPLEIEFVHAARIEDLVGALLEHRPEILHISAHGSPDGLFLEDKHGDPIRIDPRALSNLLKQFIPPLQTVLLNACESSSHAQEFDRVDVPYLIAMRARIPDDAAIEFAKGFYDALAAGEDVPVAFGVAKSSLELLNEPYHEIVALYRGAPLPQPAPPESLPKRSSWRRFPARFKEAVFVLAGLVAVIGGMASFYAGCFGSVSMRLNGTADEGRSLRFIVKNESRDAVVMANFVVHTSDDLEKYLRFGNLKPYNGSVPKGATRDIDVAIEVMEWTGGGVYDDLSALLQDRGKERIEVTASAGAVSSEREIPTSSSFLLEQVSLFVDQRAEPVTTFTIKEHK